MIEHRAPTPALLALALVVMLGGCGKKESPPPPPSPPMPITQAPAPAAPVVAEASAPMVMDGAEAAMKKSDCFTCHAVDKKVIGPAFSWVAYRYKDDKEAVAALAAKIKSGGTGNWTAYTGGAAMTPHQQLPDDGIKAMAQWVLSREPVEPPKK